MSRILAIIFILAIAPLQAQNFYAWQYKDRYFSLHAGAGKTAYFGELNQPKRIQKDPAHITLAVEARLLSRISGRIFAGYYKIKGDDAWASDSSYQVQRNLDFRSKNFEFGLQGVYFFRRYNGNYHLRGVIDPYVAIGMGFTRFNPVTTLNGKEFELRSIQTEGVQYAKSAVIIPASAGVKLRITPFVNLNFEIAYRYSLSDYLDDVSTSYPGRFKNSLQEVFSNRKDEIGIVNQQAYDRLVAKGDRGNPSSKDQYMFFSAQLEIFMPSAKGSLFKRTAPTD